MKTLGVIEAAAILRIHKDTLVDRVKSGEIRGVKIGRAWVFIEEDLVEYIRARYAVNQPQVTAPPESGIQRSQRREAAYLKALVDARARNASRRSKAPKPGVKN